MAVKWLKKLFGTRKLSLDPEDAAFVTARRSEAAYESGKADRRAGRPSNASRFIIGREQLAYLQGYSVNPAAARTPGEEGRGDG